MRTARLITLAIAAVVLLSWPAYAKQGVRAKLEATARVDAAAGQSIRIAWRLVDAGGRPFAASGIYLRVTRCAGGARRVNARELGRGRFSARVVVPRGAIRDLRVGLVGWRIQPGEKARRADRLFAFDPPLVRRCR